MVLDNDQEVTRWIEVLEQAYDAAQNEGTLTWDSLAERVSAAEDVNSTALEAFVRDVGNSGQGVELVAGIVAEKSRFPGLYWELVTPAGEMAGAQPGPLDWVTAEQQTHLEQLWGDDWARYLPEQLAYRWGGGWEQHPDEHKVGWLTALLAEFAAEPAAAEPAAAPHAAAEASTAEAADPVSAAVISAVAAVPGAEQLSEEDISVVMAQVRARMEGAAK